MTAEQWADVLLDRLNKLSARDWHKVVTETIREAVAGETQCLRGMGLALLEEWQSLETINWRNPKHPDFLAEYERRKKEWTDVVPSVLPSSRSTGADKQSQVSAVHPR